MSIDDQDNYYVLDEEQNIIEDDSPRNFASYSLEEEEEAEDNNNRLSKKNKSSLGLLFKIMFNPVEGWKDLRRSGMKLEALQSGCFYPLLALLAISEFADFFYQVNVDLSQVVTKGVVIFVAFFFGYFSIPIILNWVLPKDMMEKFDSLFGKEYVMISLSTLAIFYMLTNLLPMLWPILIFLPIWTFYLMFKGVRFFKFAPRQEMKFFIYSSFAVVGVPLFIEWTLSSILPY